MIDEMIREIIKNWKKEMIILLALYLRQNILTWVNS